MYRDILLVSKEWNSILSNVPYVEGTFSYDELKEISCSTDYSRENFLWAMDNVEFFGPRVRKSIKRHIDETLEKYPQKSRDRVHTYLRDYMVLPENLWSIIVSMFYVDGDNGQEMLCFMNMSAGSIPLWVRISAMFNRDRSYGLPLISIVDLNYKKKWTCCYYPIDVSPRDRRELQLFLRLCSYTNCVDLIPGKTVDCISNIPLSSWLTDEFISDVGNQNVMDIVAKINESRYQYSMSHGTPITSMDYNSIGLKGDYPWLRDHLVQGQ
jgi:hypothetical protein